jgi:hypothetical protein
MLKNNNLYVIFTILPREICIDTTIFFDYNIMRKIQIVIRGKKINPSKVYPK